MVDKIIQLEIVSPVYFTGTKDAGHVSLLIIISKISGLIN